MPNGSMLRTSRQASYNSRRRSERWRRAGRAPITPAPLVTRRLDTMITKKKAQRRVLGDVVRIGLGDGFHTYARVLPEALFAFYDGRVQDELPVSQIIGLPILFEVPVMDHAVKRGRWVVVGSAPLDERLLNPPPRFIKTPYGKTYLVFMKKGEKFVLRRGKSASGLSARPFGSRRMLKIGCVTITRDVRTSG